MINLIPVLSTVLFIIAISLILIVLLVNFYFKIRRKFPKSVNCWFCNSWTKVAYDDRNSFDCPNCLQYNGFNKDGSYNKIISEQHDELMNKSTRIKTNRTAASNGLCILCNNNQQLKVFQLANFVPLVEENYDVEIEHFQKQLEKAYKLCRKCDKVLTKTIEKQSAWLFGNRVKSLCNKGISSLGAFSGHVTKSSGRSLLSKLSGIISIILVFSIIFIMASSIKIFTKALLRNVSAPYLTTLKNIISSVNSVTVIEVNWSNFSQIIKLEPYIAICSGGLLLQIFGLSWEKYSTTIKTNRLLCWAILLLTAWIRFHKNYATYISLIQLFCCIYLICTSFNKIEEKTFSHKSTGKVMRKLVKNLENTCSDFSDASDFEDISSSSRRYGTTTSHDSSDYLNKSTYSSQFPNHVPIQNHNLSTAGNVLNSSFGLSNCSFATAKSTQSWRHQSSLDSDLNKSLNNLHLGGLQFKSPNTPSLFSVALKRPKPVLSPPKLQTMNSWLAGGFWRNVDGVILPVAQRTNLSRSSSESSGFGSQHNDNLICNNLQFPQPRNNFFEFDSAGPNPNYVFTPINSVELKRPGQTFYPNLHQNNMLLLQGDKNFVRNPNFSFGQTFHLTEPYQRKNWSDKVSSQASQSFKDLSLQSNTDMFHN